MCNQRTSGLSSRPAAGGIRRRIAVVSLLLPAVIVAAGVCVTAAAPAAEYNQRIENEYKLTVPVEKTEEVWRYLQEHYQGADSVLRQYDTGFQVSISDEYFVDRYFDTAELTLYDRKGGVRHRTRRIPDNPDHPKHGRRLVQIKLARPDDPNPLNRTEIKFDTSGRGDEPVATLLELVDKDDRVKFVEALADHNLDPRSLKETLTLEQRRRRVYISYQGEPFATITLDEVSSRRFFNKYEATEVEIELNEINYTVGDAQTRQMMQEVSDLMKNDLGRTFDYIEQDQEPKYNKALSYFKENVSFFDKLIAFF